MDQITIATQATKQGIEPITFQEADTIRKEVIWRNLAGTTVEHAINAWLDALSPLTRKNYRSGITRLIELGLIDPMMSLQQFSMTNHDNVLDRIKTVPSWGDCSRQARAACYIAFTRFLSRRTDGLIKRVQPSREGTSRTFCKVHDKVVSEALTQDEWHRLLHEMRLMNQRDATAAALCLQGARRIGEVLCLRIEDVDLEHNQVKVTPSKTKGLQKTIIVTIPESLANSLKAIIGDRTDGYLFATSTGKAIDYKQFTYTLKKAAKKANISKRVHPHSLRASAVTHYRSLGFQDFQVQRLTGHASTAMLNAYDKSEQSMNASKLVALV